MRNKDRVQRQNVVILIMNIVIVVLCILLLFTGALMVEELKSAFTDEEIAEIIRRIESFDYLSGITFISFNYDNLPKVRAIRPEAVCQFLTGDVSDEMIARLVGDKLDIDAYHEPLTEERIAALHAAGIRINCWTVDNKERAEQLAGWGVDYITSNILEAQA